MLMISNAIGWRKISGVNLIVFGVNSEVTACQVFEYSSNFMQRK